MVSNLNSSSRTLWAGNVGKQLPAPKLRIYRKVFPSKFLQPKLKLWFFPLLDNDRDSSLTAYN